MVEVLPAIQAAMQAAQKLRELAKKVGDADIRMAIAELSENLADAKLQAADLKGQLAELMDENRGLRETLEARSSAAPNYEGSVYVFDGDDGKYCTACWDAHQNKVRVTDMKGRFADMGINYRCPVCKATM